MSIHLTKLLSSIQSAAKPMTLAAAAVAVLIASPVQADELRPVEGRSLQLGSLSGVAYYTVQEDGYRLVATLAGRDGTPVRFESVMSPGQTIVVSVPGVAGAAAEIAEFSRDGDRLLVKTTAVPTN